MKKLFWVICLLACAASAARADFVKFSETYKESLKSFTEDEFVEYFTVARVSFSASGSITIPGLSSNALNQLEGINLVLGGLDYFATLEEATSASANKLVFKIYKEVETEEETDFIPVGTITLTRKGNVLAFELSAEKLDGEDISIAAVEHAGSDEDEEGDSGSRKVSGSTQFGLSFGSEELTFGPRTLYYKGTAKFTEVSKGSGEDELSFTLATVEIEGAADYTKPTISITAPRSNQRVTNDVNEVNNPFLAIGKAGDNRGLEELGVNVRVNGGDFSAADYNPDTGDWSIEIPLAPGTNTIEAFSVDRDGNVSSTAMVNCFRVLTNALTLIYSEGNDVTGLSDGQVLEVGRGYKVTARPGPTNLFSYWSNSVTELISTNAVLSFLMAEDLVLEAHFIPNPWLPNAGTYNGLFYPVAGVAPSNSGFLRLKLTEAGKVTGKLIQAGKDQRPLSGQVGLDGVGLAKVEGKPSTMLFLQFDLTNGTGKVEGSVSNAAWQTAFLAARQVAQPALAGNHTFAIPGAPAEESTNRPAGDGVGILTIKTNGTATLAGNLGEGSAITAGSGIAADGEMPVFAALHGGKGIFLGWVNVSTGNAPYTASSSTLTWLKPGGLAKQATYPGGFSETKTLLGARYVAPPTGTNALNWTNGAVLLDGAQLTTTISNAVTLAGRKLTVIGSTNKLALSFDAPKPQRKLNGKVSGSFIHPVTRSKSTIKGIILQLPDADVGKGWFISTKESGYLDLQQSAP